MDYVAIITHHNCRVLFCLYIMVDVYMCDIVYMHVTQGEQGTEGGGGRSNCTRVKDWILQGAWVFIYCLIIKIYVWS